MKNKISTVLLSVILVFTLVLANFSVYATSNPGIGDKKIDLADVVYLAQYVAGWDVTLQSVTYADTTGDGKIDLVDVTYLAQYVAGWNVELGAAPSIISPTSPDFFNNSNDSNIWNYLPNEDEVNVLMWRKYSPSEQAVIDQYEQMTGVDIVTTFTTEAEYRTKLVSMVAYGNAPDVAILSVNQFPELVTKSMQPLKTAEFYLDSDCWNKTYMDAYKVNGRYYGVSIPSSLICDMYNYVTYYSPELLKSSGVTTMPYDLYKVGK